VSNFRDDRGGRSPPLSYESFRHSPILCADNTDLVTCAVQFRSATRYILRCARPRGRLSRAPPDGLISMSFCSTAQVRAGGGAALSLCAAAESCCCPRVPPIDNISPPTEAGPKNRPASGLPRNPLEAKQALLLAPLRPLRRGGAARRARRERAERRDRGRCGGDLDRLLRTSWASERVGGGCGF